MLNAFGGGAPTNPLALCTMPGVPFAPTHREHRECGASSPRSRLYSWAQVSSTFLAAWLQGGYVTLSGPRAGGLRRFSYKKKKASFAAHLLPPLGRELAATDGGDSLPCATSSCTSWRERSDKILFARGTYRLSTKNAICVLERQKEIWTSEITCHSKLRYT